MVTSGIILRPRLYTVMAWRRPPAPGLGKLPQEGVGHINVQGRNLRVGCIASFIPWRNVMGLYTEAPVNFPARPAPASSSPSHITSRLSPPVSLA